MPHEFVQPVVTYPEVYSLHTDKAVTFWRFHATGLQAAKLLLESGYSESLSTRQIANFMIDQEIDKSNLRADKERLAQLSNTDSLTGLANRRAAEHAFERLSSGGNTPRADERRRGTTSPFNAQVLFLDFDNFKAVNDEKGHQAGDDLLIAGGALMVGNTRSGDIVARWGGDEFVILLPHTPKARAHKIADIIREEIGNITGTTISVGVGEVDSTRSLAETVSQAGTALKKAKQTGKNVVVHIDDVVIDMNATEPSRVS